MNALPSVTDWLEQFAACVRDRDLQRARELFDPAVRSFGTRAETANDLAELVERQWSRVWPNTRGFRFLNETVEEIAAPDDSLVCVLALWDSEGLAGAGETFVRRGRCTILLRRAASSAQGYVAVHTHFSKMPSAEL